MTAGWRECADPVELAAAVAAGVEVRWGGVMAVTDCRTADEFGSNVRLGTTYFVPSSWSPESPAPVTGGDLRERIARAIYEEKHDGPWKNANHPDWVQSLRSADAVLAVLPPQPAPSPVPPWPGAVLSGLTDEDGVPTWLAQAGQVRGEQVRCSRNLSWVPNHGGYGPGVWVEVRAPRAVPEPETERVSVWDALMNERTAIGYDGTPMKLRRGQTILYTRVDGGGGRLMYDDASHPEGKRPLVAPDGTVEVLKDGDR